MTEDDERDFERFMLPSTAPSRSLASIIMQKIQEKEAETDELTTEKVHGIVLLRNSTKNTYALCFRHGLRVNTRLHKDTSQHSCRRRRKCLEVDGPESCQRLPRSWRAPQAVQVW